jgi:hypothetical protein
MVDSPGESNGQPHCNRFTRQGQESRRAKYRFWGGALPFRTIALETPGDRMVVLDRPAQRSSGETCATPKPKRTARIAQDVREAQQPRQSHFRNRAHN